MGNILEYMLVGTVILAFLLLIAVWIYVVPMLVREGIELWSDILDSIKNR